MAMRDDGQPKREDLGKIYDQTTTSFRTLAETRFKLLGLLPLGTVLGVSTIQAEGKNAGVFAFGALVTIALWVYDQRNNQHYDELVSQAADLERRLGLYGGPFDARPTSWWRLFQGSERELRKGGFAVEHRWPITTIYAAALIVWVGQFACSVLQVFVNSTRYSVAAYCLSASAVYIMALLVHASNSEQGRRWSQAVREAHDALARYPVPGVVAAHGRTEVENKIAACADPGMIKLRLDHFLGADCDKAPYRNVDEWGRPKASPLGPGPAALILAQLIDLPPRWIMDLAGRRAKDNARKRPLMDAPLPLRVLAVVAAVAVVLAILESPFKPTPSSATEAKPMSSALAASAPNVTLSSAAPAIGSVTQTSASPQPSETAPQPICVFKPATLAALAIAFLCLGFVVYAGLWSKKITTIQYATTMLALAMTLKLAPELLSAVHIPTELRQLRPNMLHLFARHFCGC